MQLGNILVKMVKRGKKKEFSVKEQYEASWEYIKESKNYIYLAIILFFAFALIGFLVPAPETVSNQIIEFIRQLLEKTEGMSQWELVEFIFLNNIRSSFVGMISGILFGILPFITIFTNGYVLGFVSNMAVAERGFSSLLSLIPHGIFELPALFISLGLGLKLWTFVFEKEKLESFKKYVLNSLKVFLFIILPLLIIAAIIEGSLIFFAS